MNDILLCAKTGEVFQVSGETNWLNTLKFCPGCGKEVHTPNLWRCVDTGNLYSIIGNAKFCPGCGKILPASWREDHWVKSADKYLSKAGVK